MKAVAPRSVDEYIAQQPPAFQPQLEKLRAIIRSVAPDAEEGISYQVPCFRHHYMLVGIGVNKKYCSLYVMSPSLVKAMKGELEKVQVSGATLHFLPDQALPTALIKKIVKARMQENVAKAKK
ncbi:DUF1801 domain-containing protein [Chitinophaga agrisoli]|uniref:DUF1801 domain-containing protein n=1 Tax=Chitinophaga agrisoli TaxID=2607653 RepID=A0A5B2VMB6_9BACT|nr:DUF1801 domain-containing protein [Chitinophaga agrisoli]KAA2239442.1 DUF1801 domain-containing protein [Chitinophaga agrisoli]